MPSYLPLLRSGCHADLAAIGSPGLTLVHVSGRGCRVAVPAGWISLVVPLSGSLVLETQDGSWPLAARTQQLWRDLSLAVSSRGAAGWLQLSGPEAVWAAVASGAANGAPALFLQQKKAARPMVRMLVGLARRLRDGRFTAAEPLLFAICDDLLKQQAELHKVRVLCSGRSRRARDRSLHRLLRLRHYIQVNLDQRLDVGTLAGRSNYSPQHLNRIFRKVFGETPIEYATRLRRELAWRLVLESDLPISDIAGAIGFKSQSSFCRRFRETFGRTASAVRGCSPANRRARNQGNRARILQERPAA